MAIEQQANLAGVGGERRRQLMVKGLPVAVAQGSFLLDRNLRPVDQFAIAGLRLDWAVGIVQVIAFPVGVDKDACDGRADGGQHPRRVAGQPPRLQIGVGKIIELVGPQITFVVDRGGVDEQLVLHFCRRIQPGVRNALNDRQRDCGRRDSHALIVIVKRPRPKFCRYTCCFDATVIGCTLYIMVQFAGKNYCPCGRLAQTV